MAAKHELTNQPTYRRGERFPQPKVENEPTHKAIGVVRLHGEIPFRFSRTERFAGHGQSATSGQGAFDQMYDTTQATVTAAIIRNRMMYTLKRKGARFATNKAETSNSVRAPHVKSDVSDALGPGTYDIPNTTIRIRSASRKSSFFASSSPRFLGGEREVSPERDAKQNQNAKSPRAVRNATP